MESKRQSQQEDDKSGDQKRSCENSQLSETWRIIRSFRYLLLNLNELKPYLVDSVRNMIRQELELQLATRPSSIQTEISGARRFLKLDFRNELPDTIYTLSKLKATDNSPLKLVLLDIESGSIVCDENDPLSSIKVEICVLDGEFGSDGSENWSKDEFNSKILPPRPDKGKLLKGDTVIALKNGIGFIHPGLSVTDNSSWIRTRCFRLGAKVAKSNLNDATIIKEGISKPFIVKDYRVNKSKDPTPTDEIWHLKHISKKGKIFEELFKNGIHTVGDLLKEHETNPSSLEEKLSKISKRKREEILKQAKKAKHAETGVAETILFDGQNNVSENNTLNSDQRGAPDEESPFLSDPEYWSTFFDELQNDNDEAEPSVRNCVLNASNKGKGKMM